MKGLSELLSNQRLRLGELLAARAAASPEAPALREGGAVITHGALQARIAEAAARLRDAGLGAGDRLLIAEENGAAALIHLLAALALEAVAVPVEPGRAAEIGALCEPRLVLRADGRIAPGPGGAPEEVGQPAARQPALIAFPAGGKPRGVALGHRGLAWNAVLVAQERHHGPGDLLLAAAPITDPAVLVEVIGMLHCGGACLLPPRFGPEAIAELVEREGVTTLLAPAALLAELPAGTPNRLRKLALCGPPASEELAARIEAALGLRALPCHAAPESGPVVAFVRPGEPAPAGSVGRPLPGVELRVVDAAGQSVPPGQEGELLVRSAGVMLGYWRDPVATGAAFAAGRFLRSRCLAARDAEGHLTILGRLRDAILRGGVSVHPAEIEALLDRQAGVARAAVIAHHDDLLAFVEPRAGEAPPEPAALSAALARQLAPYKRPSRILVVSRLPMGPGGEIQRGTLPDLLV